MPRIEATPNDDVVAFITVKLHSNGMLSTSGNIGDTAFALQLLDNARDAVKGQRKPKNQIIIPSRDVEAQQSPSFPTRPIGDMRPEERGDGP